MLIFESPKTPITSNFFDKFRIYQLKPCVRSINLSAATPFSWIEGRAKVNFPYMNFVVRYEVRSKGFFYRGMAGCGLQLFLSKNPIKSFRSQVYYPFTDCNSGDICTNHRYDNKYFKSEDELCKFFINEYWSYCHHIDYQKHNDEINLDHLDHFNFSKFDHFKDKLKGKTLGFNLGIKNIPYPKDEKFN